jgi:hypothetical protein
VLLQVFVMVCAASSEAGCPALDVRVDTLKLLTNQNMFSHPGIRVSHAKDEPQTFSCKLLLADYSNHRH